MAASQKCCPLDTGPCQRGQTLRPSVCPTKRLGKHNQTVWPLPLWGGGATSSKSNLPQRLVSRVGQTLGRSVWPLRQGPVSKRKHFGSAAMCKNIYIWQRSRKSVGPRRHHPKRSPGRPAQKQKVAKSLGNNVAMSPGTCVLPPNYFRIPFGPRKLPWDSLWVRVLLWPPAFGYPLYPPWVPLGLF